MKVSSLFLLIAMTMFMLPLSAQDKQGEEDIQDIIEKMEDDWRFAFPLVRWMEDQSSFDHYLSTVRDRCPDELEDVLEMAESCYQESQQVILVEKQVYRKPGVKKWEANLAKYFKDPDRAKERFATAHRSVEMYETMANMFPPIIEGKRNKKYAVPQGDLVSFEYHSGGGMMYRPPIHGELRLQEDGSYIALLDTDAFGEYDTVVLTKAQVDEIRKLLIDGEVYKMPRYHDTPVMILDGPSSSVSVKFTDGEYRCLGFPPREWGGQNIIAVYNYLRELHPKSDARR